MDDVIVVGAGPAGSVAATLLARAGARVRLIDRARFPREKLCGDTLNPGTLAILRRLGLAADLERAAIPVDGMLVTGGGGVAIEGRYPAGLRGVSLSRRDLDWMLVEAAVAAGVRFEPGVAVHDALVTEPRGARLVGGVTIGMPGSAGSPRLLRAGVTIGADGRHSALAFRLGLARHPARPRRWAVGAYFEVAGDTSVGEMHLRPGRYIGVAPSAGGLTNVCLVRPWQAGAREFGDPEALLRRELAADPMLRDRFAGARIARPPIVLGPLAVEAVPGGPRGPWGVDGLVLAGDAAGFIDPMTGDGLRFAVAGGELAAAAALEALAHGWSGVQARHEARRRRAFGAKWRFNRALRTLVASPLALRSASRGARLAPGLVRAIIARAGDCDLARRGGL